MLDQICEERRKMHQWDYGLVGRIQASLMQRYMRRYIRSARSESELKDSSTYRAKI